MSIPVLTPSSTPEETAKVCREIGFFYFTDHGIPEELIRSMFDQSSAFFSLPREKKAEVQATAEGQFKGWTPMGEEVLDPKKQTKGDTKEGYYIGREPTEAEKDIKMMSKNVWPDSSLLPHWKETMERYNNAMQKLGRVITELIAKSMGVDVDEFMKFFDLPVSTLRLLHYDTEKSDPSKGCYGAGAHTDYGMITMLAVDKEEPGLEVFSQDAWIPVPPLKNAFIINLGDMLQRWTNDAYTSTLHRVINKTGNERLSTAVFYDPAYTTQVAVLPQFISEANPCKYEPINSLDHLLTKYHQTHKSFDVTKVEDGTPS
eukprot:TRINITY_DN15836_c0_g1_i1.p1 TRINITY_DN15836_c0_g1~~TRINITY_DN15836_c0_g1_i1.p1  ORF type:complete len:316 (+),score=62.54 TRINITY_DN15836_c0_g1_i1:36-983(+)